MTRPRAPSGFSSPAFVFVLTTGVVNLFGDITYEGGASINGPFMASLGASAAIVSITAGLGEFLGYALRLPAGYAADRTGRYWLITFVGYVINLFAVPAMALAGSWQFAAALVLAERIGRALRKPTVEAMLSYTTNELGKGWVYALNTALDEIGATLGPLLIALVLLLTGDYRTGYALLLISAMAALIALVVARVNFPLPSRLEQGRTAPAEDLTPAYWLYMLAGALFAAGLMSFELISYHLSKSKVASEQWIPLMLAISTGFGVLASLAFGKLYDRFGLPIVITAVSISAAFAPFVFLGGFYLVLFGMLLWGIGYATQDTLLKAIVAEVLPEGKRNFAFGLYYAGYGVGWLVGSAATGVLYERYRITMIVFSIAAQLASVPIFVWARRRQEISR
ncbi:MULTISPECIES: MFS transporter [unclassified Bradyrhizobium]|uniref:MFS transporter n=1 Tax=unclassified Bradyrhizobium TaxID=2631580 RepID=UPI002479FBC2|nr:MULTISPECIES: MFS transporter [unclassified Bradyrhizobium]WGR71777.1 MFS transporter [Bradyrhizobium sp. ISRA426]WGR76612.1 MFS transporter [Bradyrhizobium sp. ISRA430]WGR87017.1 MFS transporter [Bradyrhizobium sp. ISRA432]